MIEFYNFSISFRESSFSLNIPRLIINKNEIIGLAGESGSGKTLTGLSVLKLIQTGFKIDIKGEINIIKDGKKCNIVTLDYKKLNRIRGDRINMVFQEPMTSLNPSMKCGFQIGEQIRIHHGLRGKSLITKIKYMLKEVQLDGNEVIDKYPFQLSGGQRQRVMIAMALSTNPDLLILDEPTTALDVTVQKSILELLKKLKDKYEMSMLFVSHDLAVISQIADRIIIMKDGQIIEEGITRKILLSPQTDYTKLLLKCRPTMETEKRKLPTKTDNDKEINKLRKDIQRDETLISIKNIHKTFKSAHGGINYAVNDVSFEIYRGEVFGLVGESGSGKTTLGKIIAGLTKTDKGSVEFLGKDIDSLNQPDKKKFREKVQIIFQDPYSSLNPRRTVGQILREPVQVHQKAGAKEVAEKVSQVLKDVQLDDSFYYRYPHQLSGGQRQRVSIARVLLMNPEFIVCDESVSALDVSIQAEILNLLNKVKKKYNLTYLFISHDLAVVKYMSDRIIIIKDGQVVESGDSEKIFKSPQKEYTKNLLEAIPEINI